MQSVSHDSLYTSLLGAVREKYGYDFSGYMPSSLYRRIDRFMSSNRIVHLEDLSAMLLKDEAIFESFVQSLSVTVTELFRDPMFFASLADKVMPRLATYPVIKVWIAGCATGQEVYSVAIVLKEAGLLDRSIIYATDINQQSLAIARQGIYPVHEVEKYESNYIKYGGKSELASYYSRSGGSILFQRSLTEKIIYSPHNLATDKSFNEFQLILCRNVIMYFDRELQDRVLGLFKESLCTFGYVGLGDKESLHFSTHQNVFEEVDRRQKIYKKIIFT